MAFFHGSKIYQLRTTDLFYARHTEMNFGAQAKCVFTVKLCAYYSFSPIEAMNSITIVTKKIHRGINSMVVI